MPRCDLQVHSRYSDRPSEWILRKLGMPESYTSPLALYETLKKRGCDFITITDHNCIDGCLEIAHLPGVFISEEVTTYFPEDECKIHLLVWNLNEQQHNEISKIRKSIYELSAYLREEKLTHGVAHPLLSLNNRLTAAHFEKLILLFKIFESFNGTRNTLAQEVATLCLQSLTPKKITELASHHRIEPTHPEPWKKSLTGASDDHGGLYMGLTWTEVDDAPDVQTFLSKIETGQARVGGQQGDALRASTSIYHIVTSYAEDRLGKLAPKGMNLLKKMGERFLAGENPTNLSLHEKITHLFELILSGQALDLIPSKEISLNRELASYFLSSRVKEQLDQIVREESTPERRTFRMASKIVNDVSYRLFLRFLDQLHHNRWLDALQPLSGLIPLNITLAPYFFSFHHLHGDRKLLKKTAQRFCSEIPKSFENKKRAWFTDTLEDVNGVARTIRAMCLSARKAGEEIVVVTSRAQIEIDDIPIKNFQPVGEFEIPEYELQKLSFPPILEIVDYIQRENFTECIISTPGPIGLAGICAAKLLGLRATGIYHTDFPQYVRILSDDEMLETVAWSYMQWFYAQIDFIYVNSNFYKQCWMDRGVDSEKLKVLPRGLDTELFNPKHRDENYWKKRSAKGSVILYVGRISKEKELGFLADVFEELRRRQCPVSLALVGEGPYRKELSERIPEAIFTGILTGRELGIAYASADLFAFPSTTDTFGNVVIEALSSGLPVMVSDVGGPCELITHEHDGRILPAHNLQAWANAIEEFVNKPISRHQSLSRAQVVHAERSWDQAFQKFWREGFDEI